MNENKQNHAVFGDALMSYQSQSHAWLLPSDFNSLRLFASRPFAVCVCVFVAHRLCSCAWRHAAPAAQQYVIIIEFHAIS